MLAAPRDEPDGAQTPQVLADLAKRYEVSAPPMSVRVPTLPECSEAWLACRTVAEKSLPADLHRMPERVRRMR